MKIGKPIAIKRITMSPQAHRNGISLRQSGLTLYFMKEGAR